MSFRLTLVMALLVVATLGSPRVTLGWGDLGHRVVCEIAYQEVSKRARAEVRRLIAKDPGFRTFADSCTWADHPHQRDPDHFINVPRDFTAFTSQDCPLAPRCLFTAIRRDFQTLKTATDDATKLESLKFLGHWIGDLHQPLHVSFADDRGGVRIQGAGSCEGSLHSAWDGCLVSRALGTNSRRIAEELHREVSEADRQAWVPIPVEAWATESLTIARRAGVGYCVQTATGCAYDAGRAIYQTNSREKTVTMGRTYLEAHRAVIRDRLRRAGVRLGALLNLALGQ